jgi:hypothetical protein
MLEAYTPRERELLSLAVPVLGLPALNNPSVRTLVLRAMDIDYPDGKFLKRGEKFLETWLKILGAISSTEAERLNLLR